MTVIEQDFQPQNKELETQLRRQLEWELSQDGRLLESHAWYYFLSLTQITTHFFSVSVFTKKCNIDDVTQVNNSYVIVSWPLRT